MSRRLLLFVVLTVAILVAAFFGLTRRFTVPSDAMTPTLKKGDEVAVFRFGDTFTSLHRKDIVVLSGYLPSVRACGRSTHPIARIVGVPGETVTDRDGLLSVDGKPLAEPYVKSRAPGASQTWHVGAGSYLVLPDNRRSRCFSPAVVPKKYIVGQVFLTYWPGDRISIS